MSKKIGPPAEKVDCDRLKTVITGKGNKDPKRFILAYFGAETEDMYKTYMDLAGQVDDIKFFYTDDAACATEYGASTPGLVFFRNFDEEVVVFDGKLEGNPKQ